MFYICEYMNLFVILKALLNPFIVSYILHESSLEIHFHFCDLPETHFSRQKRRAQQERG